MSVGEKTAEICLIKNSEVWLKLIKKLSEKFSLLLTQKLMQELGVLTLRRLQKKIKIKSDENFLGSNPKFKVNSYRLQTP